MCFDLCLTLLCVFCGTWFKARLVDDLQGGTTLPFQWLGNSFIGCCGPHWPDFTKQSKAWVSANPICGFCPDFPKFVWLFVDSHRKFFWVSNAHASQCGSCWGISWESTTGRVLYQKSCWISSIEIDKIYIVNGMFTKTTGFNQNSKEWYYPYDDMLDQIIGSKLDKTETKIGILTSLEYTWQFPNKTRATKHRFWTNENGSPSANKTNKENPPKKRKQKMNAEPSGNMVYLCVCFPLKKRTPKLGASAHPMMIL